MKHCQVCKVEYSDDVTFCSHCGNRVAEGNLEFSCPSCGRILGDTYEQFCPHCGQQVGNVQKDSSSKQGVSKKYIAIIAIIAILIGGYFGFKKDLINAGVIQPFTATEQLEYARYLAGTKEDEKEAIKWFLKSAENGNSDAQVAVGVAYRIGEVLPMDNKKACYWFEKATEQGHIDGIIFLADCYVNGIGVPQSNVKAMDLYQKAAQQGSKYAKFRVAGGYFYGYGVPKDLIKAEKMLLELSDENYADAQLSLGMSYGWGVGYNKNISEAVKQLERYVKNVENSEKKAYAYGILGDIYLNEDVVKNYSKAFAYYKLGAEGNDKRSMMGMSYCYRFGDGVDENQSEAEKWRVRAEKLTN